MCEGIARMGEAKGKHTFLIKKKKVLPPLLE